MDTCLFGSSLQVVLAKSAAETVSVSIERRFPCSHKDLNFSVDRIVLDYAVHNRLRCQQPPAGGC